MQCRGGGGGGGGAVSRKGGSYVCVQICVYIPQILATAIYVRCPLDELLPQFYGFTMHIMFHSFGTIPDNKVHGANMGPTWVLSAPDGPHVGTMSLAIRDTAASIKLSHRDRNLMDNILRVTLLNGFRVKFYGVLFLRVHMNDSKHCPI